MNRRDVIASGLLAVFFFWLLVHGIALGIDHAPGRGLDPTSPALFPYLLSMLGLLFALLVIHGARKSAATEPSEFAGSRPLPFAQAMRRTAILIGAFAGYVFLFKPLGALLSSATVFGTLLYLGGERRLTWLAAVTVGMPLVTYLLFVKLANVPLPRGPLPF